MELFFSEHSGKFTLWPRCAAVLIMQTSHSTHTRRHRHTHTRTCIHPPESYVTSPVTGASVDTAGSAVCVTCVCAGTVSCASELFELFAVFTHNSAIVRECIARQGNWETASAERSWWCHSHNQGKCCAIPASLCTGTTAGQSWEPGGQLLNNICRMRPAVRTQAHSCWLVKGQWLILH